jgi:hypothetical protein
LPFILLAAFVTLISRREREAHGSFVIGCLIQGSRPLEADNFLKQFFPISPNISPKSKISIHLQRCQSFSSSVGIVFHKLSSDDICKRVFFHNLNLNLKNEYSTNR